MKRFICLFLLTCTVAMADSPAPSETCGVVTGISVEQGANTYPNITVELKIYPHSRDVKVIRLTQVTSIAPLMMDLVRLSLQNSLEVCATMSSYNPQIADKLRIKGNN